MARLQIHIPEGQFCCDKTILDCMYDEARQGEHHCRLFYQSLEKVEIATKDENRQRVLLKCSSCLKRMEDEKPDRALEATKISKGWEF